MKTLLSAVLCFSAIVLSQTASATELNCTTKMSDVLEISIEGDTLKMASMDLFYAAPRLLARVGAGENVFKGLTPVRGLGEGLTEELVLTLPAELATLEAGSTFSASLIERFNGASSRGEANEWAPKCKVMKP